MIVIDGAIGEGGGQVLRSALTLSLLTQQAFNIRNIRAGRPKPGLRPQHLEAVRAAVKISQAEVTGAHLSSQGLIFTPNKVRAGEYALEIRTAGSAALLLQTIVIPLCLERSGSKISITGGTHVPWSPCAEYLSWTWAPAIEAMGFQAEINCERAGFFPRGGGRITVAIKGNANPAPIEWIKASEIQSFVIFSAIANLPEHILKRQIRQAKARVGDWEKPLEIRHRRYQAIDPGTVLLVQPRFEGGLASFFALGKRGLPAERVADHAIDQAFAFLATGGCVDPFLADQILIPLSLASQSSSFTTSSVTGHLLTNAAIVEAFGVAEVRIQGQEGHPGKVDINPG